jgi:hypothetical protein
MMSGAVMAVCARFARIIGQASATVVIPRTTVGRWLACSPSFAALGRRLLTICPRGASARCWAKALAAADRHCLLMQRVT